MRADAPGLKFGAAETFSFDGLRERARTLSAQAYVAPATPSPEILERLGYDAWGKIHFDDACALYAEGPNRFPATFFHLGQFFRKPVAMFVVDGDHAREIIYDPSCFDMPADSPARELGRGAGFAGFRFQEARDDPKYDWRQNDWAAFLGASYFRAIGSLHQYGLSARGAAVDTAVAGRNEEFPDFTRIYIGPQSGDTVTVFTLLEGPKITGAMKFAMTRKTGAGEGVVMDIDQSFFLRSDIARFGVAPLTSMYWFSETAKPTAVDWRPEVHDSDGLAIWTGAGERLWRALGDPPGVTVSAFPDAGPKGFGLLQRDRVFDHYLDGVFYDRRPSLWVEPRGDWGKGSVQLVELPTSDEIEDNVVAMWVPEAPAVAGAAFDFSFRLYWLADEPIPGGLARVVATRLGREASPDRLGPETSASSWSNFLGARWKIWPSGQDRSSRSKRRAERSPITGWSSRFPMARPATGARSSTSAGSRAPSPWICARSCGRATGFCRKAGFSAIIPSRHDRVRARRLARDDAGVDNRAGLRTGT